MSHSVLPTTEPALAVADRQLEMLAEVAEMTMAVCRACAKASLAASREAEKVVADTAWQCQQDRTLAMAGCKAVAEAFQKLSRSLRLTLKLELTLANWTREAKAGVWRPLERVGGTPADSHGGDGTDRSADRRPPERSSQERDRAETETETLVEVERFGDRGRRPSHSRGTDSSDTHTIGQAEPGPAKAPARTPFPFPFPLSAEPAERSSRLAEAQRPDSS